MANVTLAVPGQMASRMKKHPEIRWSQVARQAIAERLELLELLDRATNPTISEEEAVKLALKIHHSRRGRGDWRRFLRA